MEPVPQSEATTTRATRAVLLLQAALVRLMSTAARSVGRYERILWRANLAQYDFAPIFMIPCVDFTPELWTTATQDSIGKYECYAKEWYPDGCRWALTCLADMRQQFSQSPAPFSPPTCIPCNACPACMFAGAKMRSRGLHRGSALLLHGRTRAIWLCPFVCKDGAV